MLQRLWYVQSKALQRCWPCLLNSNVQPFLHRITWDTAAPLLSRGGALAYSVPMLAYVKAGRDHACVSCRGEGGGVGRRRRQGGSCCTVYTTLHRRRQGCHLWHHAPGSGSLHLRWENVRYADRMHGACCVALKRKSPTCSSRISAFKKSDVDFHKDTHATM